MKKTINLKRIAVAVSGGVDSSVAAYLLKKSFGQNNVFGLHMSNWNASDEDSHGNYCEQSERDATDAKVVCDSLGIEMQRADFVSEYWNGVFEPFVQALGEQRMVNPDVGCNTIVKFGVMREYAMNKGATFVATGHYARIWHRDSNSSVFDDPNMEQSENEFLVRSHIAGLPEEEWVCEWGKNERGGGNTSPLLLSGADLSKDQSYFLCSVNGSGLSNAMFPLGGLIKKNAKEIEKVEAQAKVTSTARENSHDVDNEYKDLKYLSVREIANQAGLPTASKKESMGICFVGKRKFADFIAQYLPHDPEPGNFVDIDTGEVS
jgi:tRNA U34 2-thiouridine synthase MnmA/TrmU